MVDQKSNSTYDTVDKEFVKAVLIREMAERLAKDIRGLCSSILHKKEHSQRKIALTCRQGAGPALDLLGNLHFERSYPLIVDIANGKTSLRSDAIELLLNRSDLESAQVASSALRDFAVGASPQARQHFVHNLIQLIRDSDVGPNKVDNAILNARITAAESLISQVPATQRDAYMTYLLELIQNKRRLQGY